MGENWAARFFTFILVFIIFWIIGSFVAKDWRLGFVIGLFAAAIFVGGSMIPPKKNY